MNPYKLLRDAIKAVPAMKYALAVAGLAAVVAVVLGLRLKPQVAVFGSLIVVGFMFVLVVFSRFAGQQAGVQPAIGPATVLVWFYTVSVILATTLFMTSFFWNWPTNLKPPLPLALPSGSVTLYDGFKFPGQSVFNFSSGQIETWGSKDVDIGVANTAGDDSSAEFFLMNDYPPYTDPNAKEHGVENAGILDMRVPTLEQVKEAPADNYLVHYFSPIVGHVYCVRTRDGHHFAKIKISGIAKDRISFDYVYQPDGTRMFPE